MFYTLEDYKPPKAVQSSRETLPINVQRCKKISYVYDRSTRYPSNNCARSLIEIHTTPKVIKKTPTTPIKLISSSKRKYAKPNVNNGEQLISASTI
jgi:hypothetical protein